MALDDMNYLYDDEKNLLCAYVIVNVGLLFFNIFTSNPFMGMVIAVVQFVLFLWMEDILTRTVSKRKQ